MKKITKTLLTFVIAFASFSNVFTVKENNSVFAANDYSSAAVVTDWNIIDSSGNALSESNQARAGHYYQMSLSWELVLSGDLLHEGDTLSFAFPKNSVTGAWNAVNSAWEDFKNDDGVVLGKWRINSRKVEVELNSNVEGFHTVSGTILTGKGSIYNNTSYKGLQNVTIGGVTKPIMFERMVLSNLDPNRIKYASTTSNSTIQWWVMPNNIGNVELSSEPRGTNFTVQKNTYVEDTITGDVTDESLKFRVYVNFPVTLEEGRPAANGAISYDVASYFTLVSQNTNETYAAYKSRLKPFEYGKYTDKNGVDTLVVNFGDIGANGLKYSDLDSDFVNNAADAAIKMGYYDETDRSALQAYFADSYSDSNVINGHVASYAVSFNEVYDKVAVETEKSNTAIITKNGETKEVTAIGKLQGNVGLSTVASSEAGVFLYDEDTNELLTGGTFKLQTLVDGQWNDYTAQPLMTTDEDGFAKTENLPLATYRFVEVSPSSDEYDLASSKGYDDTLGTVVSSEFTIKSTDTEGYKIPVSNKKFRYNVTYAPGTNGLFTDDVHSDIIVNSLTPEFAGDVDENGTPIGEEGYEFVGWDVEISPTVTETVVYTAMWRNVLTDPDPEVIPNPDVTDDVEKENTVDSTETLPETGFNQVSLVISGLILLLFVGLKAKNKVK